MNETMTRKPREMESRNYAERPKAWAPPALLPEPIPEAGFEFRWVRISTLNTPDPTNISGKLREGWEPVKSITQPHMQLVGNSNGKFPDGIEIGGLLLCKAPKEFMEQRAAYYQKQSETQMSSVDGNYMRDSDPRMPLFNERKSAVSFGNGT